MKDLEERLTTCISTPELERRWKAAREVMGEKKIDFLLMRNDEEFLGGYVKWFSDFPARYSYPFTVIFPSDDEMTFLTSGPTPPGEPYPPQWSVRGVKKRLATPYFPSIHYTSTYDAELIVEVLKEKKDATVGLVGTSFIPMNLYEYLRKHLPGATFVDATDEIDILKAIKSEEEIELIKRTAGLQDNTMEHLRKTIRPGLRDYDVMAEAQYSVVKQGSEQQLILVSSAEHVSPVRYQFRRFQNRMIREGDRVAVLIEVNGPGGFYTEIGRTFCIGDPPQELQDGHEASVEAQKISVDLLKPGAAPKDIWDANNAFLEKHGYFPERRLYAHGQGYDLVERPAIRYDEPMEILPNMNITVHPFASNKKIWVTICDNYLVTETGDCECLHKTPKEIIVI
ncbi:M24 family metallopeptidase [Thermodesulfobacteriota bacterium]